MRITTDRIPTRGLHNSELAVHVHVLSVDCSFPARIQPVQHAAERYRENSHQVSCPSSRGSSGQTL